jgi:AraC-like DNA-binding protein
MSTGATDRETRFSINAQPARDRLPYLREVFGRWIVGMELEPNGDSLLEWTTSLQPFEDLRVLSGRMSAITSRRTRSLLADGRDDLLLQIILSGVCLPFQAGRECRLDAGAAALMSCADVGGLNRPSPTRFLTLFIPRRKLGAMVVNPEDALARPIPEDTEALRLLVHYVKALLQNHGLTSPVLRQLFATHVHDLIALAVGASRQTAEVAHGRGLRAARLSAIKSDIVHQLDNERLSVTGVAEGRGVTSRYVQMLFESEGTTFTEYVIAQRLARARRMLADSTLRDRTISAIAFDVGFGNLSYFNRVFRRKFGMTPSDARRVDK